MLYLHKCRFHWPSHSEITQQVVGIVQSATTTTMRLGRLKEINFRHGWVEVPPRATFSPRDFLQTKPAPSLPSASKMFSGRYIRNQKISSFFLVFFPIVCFFFISLVIFSLELKRGPTATDVELLARHVPQSQEKLPALLQTTTKRQAILVLNFLGVVRVVAKI